MYRTCSFLLMEDIKHIRKKSSWIHMITCDLRCLINTMPTCRWATSKSTLVHILPGNHHGEHCSVGRGKVQRRCVPGLGGVPWLVDVFVFRHIYSSNGNTPIVHHPWHTSSGMEVNDGQNGRRGVVVVSNVIRNWSQMY